MKKMYYIFVVLFAMLGAGTSANAQVNQKLISIYYDNGKVNRVPEADFDSIQFATIKIETLNAENITENTATLFGHYNFSDVQTEWDTYYGSRDAYNAVGFMVGTSPDELRKYYPQNNEGFIYRGSPADSIFSVTINCTPGQTYYYRAYVMKPCMQFAVLDISEEWSGHYMLADGIKSFTAPQPAGKTWTKVGTGTYTYSQCFSGEDAGLELYQCDQEANTYKITHWAVDVDFTFTWDKTTNLCNVIEQPTGYDHPSYGMIYVNEINNYVGSAQFEQSYYDAASRTFYFDVVYFVEAGVFGYGFETFTLDGSNAVARKSINAKRLTEATPKTNIALRKVNPMLRKVPVAAEALEVITPDVQK